MEQFSTFMIVSMIFNIVIGIGLPILLVILIKKKYEMRIGPLFVGACTYLAINMLLQGAVDTAINLIQPLANFLAANEMVCAVVIAVLHGLLQLGGYYLMIHMFMKDFRRKENSLLFGVGIRIIDSVMAYGISAGVALLILAITINGQGMDAYLAAYGEATVEAEETRAALVEMMEMPVIELAGMGIICVCLMFMTIAVSVLIFQAAKRPGKMYLMPTAGAISVLNCLLLQMYSAGIIETIGKCIVYLVLLTVVSCVIAFFVYRSDTDEERGKADILLNASANTPGEMSMREKIAKVNKSSTPGKEE